jgi:hypothetical protein
MGEPVNSRDPDHVMKFPLRCFGMIRRHATQRDHLGQRRRHHHGNIRYLNQALEKLRRHAGLELALRTFARRCSFQH